MSGELDDLARAAADILVAALVTESWQPIAHRFAALTGHERRMEAAHEQLTASTGTEREMLLGEQLRAWTTRLRDALEDDPGAAVTLRAVLTELGSAAPTAVPAAAVVQRATADHGSQVVTVGGSIAGNTGEVYVGVGKVDKRTVNRFLAPFFFLGRAARQAVAGHATAAAIASVVFVLAVAAVGGWSTHWPSAIFGAGKAKAATAAVVWKPASWTAATVPMPANTSSGGLSAVSCSIAGTCVVAGGYNTQGGNYGVWLETVSHDKWTPATYEPSAPAGAADFPVNAVACPAPGNCVTAGEYRDASSGNYAGLITAKSGGNWTASGLPLPPGTGQDQEIELHGIACPAPDNCVAVGSIYDGTGSNRGWGLIETLRNGSWTPAEAPLPSDAASGDNGKGNLQAVSCPSPGNCVAVGFYSAAGGDQPGVIETLTNGTWTPSNVPLPAGGSNPWLSAISCPSVSSCVAAGYFYAGQGANAGQGAPKGLIETLAHHAWHPEAAPVPQGSTSQYGVQLQGVACPAIGDCVAVGYYNADSKSSNSYGFIDTLAVGKWTAVMAPQPGGAGRGGKGPALYAVGCASTSYCVAVAGDAIESTIPIGAMTVVASAPSPSGSTSPAPQSAQSSAALSSAPAIAGHDTPENVVTGLIQAELAGDWQTACSYYVPSVQATCTQGASQSQLGAFTGSATVSGAQVQGSEALVEVTGNMCQSTIGCNSNSDPSAGMPADQASFQQVYDQVRSSSANSSMSPVPCIQQNGSWYVDTGP
ncbi:MAG: hypothetical protein JO345_19385 [Streptosporangiaceae bacterium]|nr:hypothetical protein [Streptosporangiaceae bacterium]